MCMCTLVHMAVAMRSTLTCFLLRCKADSCVTGPSGSFGKVPSFTSNLQNTYCVLSTVPSTGDTVVNKKRLLFSCLEPSEGNRKHGSK